MSLSPYTSELGVSRAKHLLRRACFHYNKTLLYQISSLNVDQALDLLFSDNTITYAQPYDPLPTDSPHGYWLESTEYPPDMSNQGRKKRFIKSMVVLQYGKQK